MRPFSASERVGLALLVVLGLGVLGLETRAGEEDRQLRALAASVLEPGMDTRQRALALTRLTHDVLAAANSHRGGSEPDHSGVFGGSLGQFLVEGGQCGAYSMLLARLLQLHDIEALVAQMQVDGSWGEHVVTLARVGGAGLSPLDAVFDLHFVNDDGSFASSDDVISDWARYASQVPPNYPSRYDYDALRLTNWERIPVLMPAMRSAAAALFGEEAVERISLRSRALNQYRIAARAVEGIVLILLAVLWSERRRRA